MILDNQHKILYLLCGDSTIQSINIQGSQFTMNCQYKGTSIESIHLIPPTEIKNVNFMAVSSRGHRQYFYCTRQSITLIHTRLPPALPGHLLFNHLTEERINTAYYNYGIFGAVLSKSDKKFFMLLSTDLIHIPNEELVKIITYLWYNLNAHLISIYSTRTLPRMRI